MKLSGAHRRFSPGPCPTVFGLDACPWKFVICANAGGTKALSSFGFVGSASTPPLAHSLARAPIAMPSFHLIGCKDTWQKSASLEAKALFDADLASSYMHAFGHELPGQLRTDERLKQCLADFLRQFSATQEAPRAPCSDAVDAHAASPASMLETCKLPKAATTVTVAPSLKMASRPDSEASSLPPKKKNSAAQAARVQRELAALRERAV